MPRLFFAILFIFCAYFSAPFAQADVSGSLAVNSTLTSFDVSHYLPFATFSHLDGSTFYVYFEPKADMKGALAFTNINATPRYIIFSKLSIPVIAHECVHNSYFHYYAKIDLTTAEGNETLAYDVQKCVEDTLSAVANSSTISPPQIANVKKITVPTTLAASRK